MQAPEGVLSGFYLQISNHIFCLNWFSQELKAAALPGAALVSFPRGFTPGGPGRRACGAVPVNWAARDAGEPGLVSARVFAPSPLAHLCCSRTVPHGFPTGQLGEAGVHTWGFQTWQDLLLIMFPSDVPLQRYMFRSLQQQNRLPKSPSDSKAPASPRDSLAKTSAGRLRGVRPVDGPFSAEPSAGRPRGVRPVDGPFYAEPGMTSIPGGTHSLFRKRWGSSARLWFPGLCSEQRHRMPWSFTPKGPQPRKACPLDRPLRDRAVPTGM